LLYVAKFVEVSEELVRFSEHEVAFDLNFLQRLHKTLANTQYNMNIVQYINTEEGY